MKPHGPSFWFTVGIVTLFHLLIIVFLLLAGYRGCTARRRPPLIPIEFMVAVDDTPPSPPTPPPSPPPPSPPPSPKDIVLPEKKPEPPKPPEKKPEPPKPPEKKPEPPKPPEKKLTPSKPPEPKPPTSKPPLEKGRRIERPAPPPPPATPRLSPEEIRRLLDLGATPGHQTTVPTGDDLAFEIIRRTLYRAWQQPPSAPPQLKAEVELTFSSTGYILSSRLIRPSGHAEMDRSVLEAVQSVARIEGLPTDFLIRRRSVTVTFELTAGSR